MLEIDPASTASRIKVQSGFVLVAKNASIAALGSDLVRILFLGIVFRGYLLNRAFILTRVMSLESMIADAVAAAFVLSSAA